MGNIGREAAMDIRVALVTYDGCDELDVIGPAEVFRMAAGVSCEIIALGGAKWVVGSHGLRIGVDGSRVEAPDVIVVPGGNWQHADRPGARREAEHGAIPALVADNPDALLMAVCTGTMLLEAAGVLEGIAATTHASTLDQLAASGVCTVEQRVVDQGRVVTCGGVTSGIDAALWVVERLRGQDEAARIAQILEFPRWQGDPRIVPSHHAGEQ